MDLPEIRLLARWNRTGSPLLLPLGDHHHHPLEEAAYLTEILLDLKLLRDHLKVWVR
jgi:hypothetical protein